ncbi:MAG: hypothetical protein HOP19_02510, partial [Acidobacteria bacterium]|nr:hypothetical protein [Acidobacteriota bacterium]
MNYPTYIGEQLMTLIQTVRRQRNGLFWLRGLAILLAVAAGVLLLVGWAAYKQRFNAGALVGLRVGALVALLATAWLALSRPLRQRVSDAQLARLIEEKSPGLDDSLVSAIEFADDEKRTLTSAAIFERLNAKANQSAHNVNLDAIVPRKRFWQYGGAAFASVALFIGALLFGPQEIRKGLSQVVTPEAFAATTDKDALKITLKPGNARVPKGTDQKIVATTVNFEAETLTIFTRKAGAGDDQWVSAQMEPAKAKNEFQHFIFNIQEDTEYFAEAPGCKSEIYKFTVADLPYVKRIDLAYDFPAYTGMARKVVEDTGEIAALAGTSVRVMAYLTHRAKSARIVLKDGTKLDMQAENTEDGALIMAGTINVTKESSYHIELTSVDGDVYNGSNEYDIVVLEDMPPVVTFEKPGRDTRATSVEEIFSQAKAEDDYGVSSLEMFISVNGGEEKKVELQNLQREAAKSLSGAHTFFLEEYGLQPGDFVSYYAKARDARHETTSDIYFIEIKPFEKDFKQSQQAGGGGGAGGEQPNALSKQQKELIAATFRVIREEERYNEQEKTENYNTISLGQEKLRDATNQVIERIKRRMGNNLDPNSDFGKLIEYMTQAAKEMEVAIPLLKGKNAKGALPPEQRALQNLLRADAIFREIQVAQQESGQGQGSQRAEELADLFELEMDKKKNQYETIQREQQQQGQQQEDEAKRKLEELARRQQTELEQQQQRAQQGQQQ